MDAVDTPCIFKISLSRSLLCNDIFTKITSKISQIRIL